MPNPPRRIQDFLGVGIALVLVLAASRADAQDAPARAEAKALAYLAVEVPGWTKAHRCFSCHNNGDAARALYEATKRGRTLPAPDPLKDTTGWLAKPEGWDHNGGEGPFSDKTLARVQFTAALLWAVEAKAQADRAPLRRAAEILAKDQSENGSWPIEDGNGSIGTPAAYGRPLGTLMARDTLASVDPSKYREAVARADRWLAARPIASVLDASVALLAFPKDATEVRSKALAKLAAGQSEDGGWGPFTDAPPEAFDTAVALLALARLKSDDPAIRRRITHGRAFLAAKQFEDGSWPETTRPAGFESYAQRLSTAGWATLALIATGPP